MGEHSSCKPQLQKRSSDSSGERHFLLEDLTLETVMRSFLDAFHKPWCIQRGKIPTLKTAGYCCNHAAMTGIQINCQLLSAATITLSVHEKLMDVSFHLLLVEVKWSWMCHTHSLRSNGKTQLACLSLVYIWIFASPALPLKSMREKNITPSS